MVMGGKKETKIAEGQDMGSLSKLCGMKRKENKDDHGCWVKDNFEGQWKQNEKEG